VRLAIAASLPCIKAELISIKDSEFREQIKANLKRLFGFANKSAYLQLVWYDGLSDLLP
jgi:formiminotetrahydrofolate cyclodeaminase